MYGAIGNVGFRYFRPAISEAITVTGQYIIRHTADRLNWFLNKTLKEAGIREKYHCLIAGVERGGETLHAPDPHEPFVEGDVVWIVGESADVYKLVGRKCEGFDMG